MKINLSTVFKNRKAFLSLAILVVVVLGAIVLSVGYDQSANLSKDKKTVFLAAQVISSDLGKDLWQICVDALPQILAEQLSDTKGPGFVFKICKPLPEPKPKQCDDLKKALENLEGNLAQAEQRMTQLTNDLTKKQRDLDRAQRALERAQNRQPVNQANVSRLQNQVDGLENLISEINNNISEQQGVIDRARGRVFEAQSDLDACLAA
jgi:peptidoglycan hydrolase CwlO-like protein